jgi:hypothetical protein
VKDDAAGSDCRRFADMDVAQDLCTGSDEDPIANLGMPVTSLLAGCSEGYVVQNDHVVADRGCFADDHARGMVDKHTTADRRGGMNVHSEELRSSSLNVDCQRLAAGPPQNVRNPVGLKSQESFEVEKRC